MIAIPEGVNVTVENRKVSVKGPKGEVAREFSQHADISVKDGSIAVESKDRAYLGTVESLLKSMVKGVTDGYERKLKIIYAHFPITVEAKGKDITIKNFQGEKMPRKTTIIGDTKIAVKGNIVTISGPDKEAVGQTMANMKMKTKIKNKDGRIFQDGLYEVK